VAGKMTRAKKFYRFDEGFFWKKTLKINSCFKRLGFYG